MGLRLLALRLLNMQKHGFGVDSKNIQSKIYFDEIFTEKDLESPGIM